MVFEFELKARARRAVIPPLVEHMADMSGERHEAEQVLPKQAFAFPDVALSKNATRCGQFDGAFLEFGKFQDVQRLGNRKQLVDFKGERTGDVGQLAVERVAETAR